MKMNSLYCIDLGSSSKDELGRLIDKFNLPFSVDELFKMKLDGYKKIYPDKNTHKICLHTINNSTEVVDGKVVDIIHVSDFVKNNIIDISNRKPQSGMVSSTTQNKPIPDGYVLLPTDKYFSNFTQKEFDNEWDRLSSKINLTGIGSLDKNEQEFWDLVKDKDGGSLTH